MGQKTISQLPVATSVSNTDLLIVQQGGITKSTQASLLRSISATSVTEQVITASAGQTVFVSTNAYTPGTNNIFVYRNGLKLISGTDFTETNSNTVTLTQGADAGDQIVLDVGTTVAGNFQAANVAFKQNGTGAVSTNVAAKLSEIISVLDFGADPTGVTDSRNAFINAANAAIASSAQLVIPAGNYTVSGSLILANGLYAICHGNITGPSVFPENGCCFYGDNCYFYKQSDYQNVLHFSNWNVDATSRDKHTTLGLAQRYDGQANINSYYGSGNPLQCYLHYGEGRKNAGQKASGTAGALAGHVNVFSLDNGTGTGRSEIQGLAGAVTVAPDASLGASGNYYNEFSINGPTSDANREAFMAGACILVQKYCPTRTVDADHDGSYGITVTTRPGTGGFDLPRPANVENYPLNAGIAINGWTGVAGTATDGYSATAQISYDFGILIGGIAGSVWFDDPTVRSKIGTGIGITDYTNYAVDIFTKHPHAVANSGAIRVAADAGVSLFGMSELFDLEAKIQTTISSQYGIAIAVAASTHPTSERAAIALGDWIVGQDSNGSGIKDFFIYAAGANRMIFSPSMGSNIITIPNLPTSASGLASGQIWRDTAAGNVIKIVP